MAQNRITLNRDGMRRAAFGYYPHQFINSESDPRSTEEMPALQIGFLCFTTLSIALYILIISLVVVNRKKKQILNGSFFRLVVSYFIADFLFFLEFTFFFRMRKYGWLNWLIEPGTFLYDYLPPVTNTFHYYIKAVIYLGQVIFATNRLSSALFIMNYERYWTNKVLWAARSAEFLLPLLVVLPVSPLFNTNFWARYMQLPGQVNLRLETDPMSTELIAYIDAGCSTVANVLCFAMYIATFLLLRKEYKNHSTKTVRNMELRLLGAALLMFVALTLNTVIQVLTIIANLGEVHSVMFVNDLSYPVIDLMYSCQPWALLLTSSVIRTRIKALFTSGNLSTATIVSQATATTKQPFSQE